MGGGAIGFALLNPQLTLFGHSTFYRGDLPQCTVTLTSVVIWRWAYGPTSLSQSGQPSFPAWGGQPAAATDSMVRLVRAVLGVLMSAFQRKGRRERPLVSSVTRALISS